VSEPLDLSKLDIESLMHRAIELAASARSKGNDPFGALLSDTSGNIVLEAENTVGENRDATCHAEQNLMSMASRRFSREELGRLVLVTSTEPCAMCSGATFWTGVRTVVYGLPEKALCEMCTSAGNPTPPVLDHPCAEVFAGCYGHPTQVIGPVLEEESRVPHHGFWT